MRLFFFGQVSVNGNQLTEPLRYSFPSYGVLFFVVMVGEVKALAVVVNEAAFSVQICVRMSAYTIFLFQKGKRVLLRVKGLIKLIYAVLSIFEARAAHKFVVQVGLRNGKGGGLFSLRLLDLFYLLVCRGEKT